MEVNSVYELPTHLHHQGQNPKGEHLKFSQLLLTKGTLLLCLSLSITISIANTNSTGITDELIPYNTFATQQCNINSSVMMAFFFFSLCLYILRLGTDGGIS